MASTSPLLLLEINRARSGKKKVPVWSEYRRAEEGGVCGGGIPLLSRLGDLGERRELPQRGMGRSPPQKTIFVRSEGARMALVAMHATEMT